MYNFLHVIIFDTAKSIRKVFFWTLFNTIMCGLVNATVLLVKNFCPSRTVSHNFALSMKCRGSVSREKVFLKVFF